MLRVVWGAQGSCGMLRQLRDAQGNCGMLGWLWDAQDGHRMLRQSWDAHYSLVGDSKLCMTSLQHHAGAFCLGFFSPFYFFFFVSKSSIITWLLVVTHFPRKRVPAP